MSKRIIFLLCLFVCLLNVNFIQAQNNTKNPYSMYGLGELRPQTNAANAGIGNVGIGMKSKHFLNATNAASYSGLDSLNFLFEMGVDSKISTFESLKRKANATTINFSYLTLGTRISSKFAFALGINPYSNVGYEINTTGEVIGAEFVYPLDISGSGNINRAYVAFSYSPFKNLSVGVKPSFLFGSIQQTQLHRLSNIDITAWEHMTSLPFSDITNVTKNYFHNFIFEFGAQYTIDLKKVDLTLGAIYNPGMYLVSERNDNTFDSNGNVFENTRETNDDFQVPEEYGAGISFKTRQFIGGIDVGVQKWSNYDYNVTRVKLKDNPYIRAGLEYTPSYGVRDNYFKRINYRAGFQYAESYMKFYNMEQDEYCISLGLGLPVARGSRIDVGFEFGKSGSTAGRLIQENYCRIRLGFSLRDIWFQKRIYD